MIEVRRLSKRIGHREILRDIQFDLPTGQFLSVFGPNGAGKTTLLRILAGLMKPTSGEILVDGEPLGPERYRLRKTMGVLSHKSYLYESLTARENLIFYGKLYGVNDLAVRTAGAINRVGLGLFADDLVRTFSRGMEQRLALARATLHDPRILLLDEPHTGLDAKASDTLDRVLADFKAGGSTVIMVSHDLERGLRLSDRYLVLSRGKLILQGESDGVTPADLEESMEGFLGEGAGNGVH